MNFKKENSYIEKLLQGKDDENLRPLDQGYEAGGNPGLTPAREAMGKRSRS